MQFSERSPLEAGFAQVFQADVRPKLLVLEEERIQRLRNAYRYVAVVLAVTIALIGLVYVIWGGDGFFGYVIVAMLGGVAAYLAWTLQASGWNSSVEDAVMPAICAHVGDLEFDSNGGPFPIAEMHDLDLLPGHDSRSLSDWLRGTHNGTGYELVHATLSRQTRNSKGESRSRTVFTGLLIHIDVPVDVPGKVVLMRDHGGFGNTFSEMFSFGGARSMPKVEFDHAAFEAAFEVYADQPEDVRNFMPDPFLDALLNIGEDHGGGRGAKSFVAGFQNRSFFMALARKGAFMRMGKLTTPVANMEDDLHAIFDDIALSHQIIDRLHGA